MHTTTVLSSDMICLPEAQKPQRRIAGIPEELGHHLIAIHGVFHAKDIIDRAISVECISDYAVFGVVNDAGVEIRRNMTTHRNLKRFLTEARSFVERRHHLIEADKLRREPEIVDEVRRCALDLGFEFVSTPEVEAAIGKLSSEDPFTVLEGVQTLGTAIVAERARRQQVLAPSEEVKASTEAEFSIGESESRRKRKAEKAKREDTRKERDVQLRKEREWKENVQQFAAA